MRELIEQVREFARLNVEGRNLMVQTKFSDGFDPYGQKEKGIVVDIFDPDTRLFARVFMGLKEIERTMSDKNPLASACAHMSNLISLHVTQLETMKSVWDVTWTAKNRKTGVSWDEKGLNG